MLLLMGWDGGDFFGDLWALLPAPDGRADDEEDQPCDHEHPRTLIKLNPQYWFRAKISFDEHSS